MIHEFTAEQIEHINGMSVFSQYEAMHGTVLPSPDLPVTYDSLVEQYGDQARYAVKTFGLEESMTSVLAEAWASMDIEIFREIKDSGVDLKEFLQEEHRKLTETTVRIDSPVAPTHEISLLINCQTDSEVLNWISIFSELRNRLGCVSASMQPIIEEPKDDL